MFRAMIIAAILCLTGCATNEFIGVDASTFAKASCDITKERCEFSIGEEGYLVYTVTTLGDGKYRVAGKSYIDMSIVGAMRPRVSFFIVFMDAEKVFAERKVKTGGKRGLFDFELDTNKKIQASSAGKFLFHYRS